MDINKQLDAYAEIPGHARAEHAHVGGVIEDEAMFDEAEANGFVRDWSAPYWAEYFAAIRWLHFRNIRVVYE